MEISLLLTSLLCLLVASSGASRIQQTSHQHVFIKDEFHFLDVPGVGRSSALDIYDCIFKCLLNPQCNSVNMAAETDAVRKLWCELLPSDIYKNSKDYNKNMSSHHFSMQTPCSSSPCQNGGTCLANYKEDTYHCLCEDGFIGTYCEKGKQFFCKLQRRHPSLPLWRRL